jgi:hypothetical protein
MGRNCSNASCALLNASSSNNGLTEGPTLPIAHHISAFDRRNPQRVEPGSLE